MIGNNYHDISSDSESDSDNDFVEASRIRDTAHRNARLSSQSSDSSEYVSEDSDLDEEEPVGIDDEGPGMGHLETTANLPVKRQVAGALGTNQYVPVNRNLGNPLEDERVIETNRLRKERVNHSADGPVATHGGQTKHRQIVNDYIFDRELGAGAFGAVRKAKNRKNEQVYAVKVMKRDASGSKIVSIIWAFCTTTF
jgi:hypothetical protein